jgi:uncharacterized damage-inducible protein DinB
MTSRALAGAMVWLVTGFASFGQTTDAGYADAFSSSTAGVVRAMHGTIRRNLVEAAEEMPAGDYGFRPTPDVRSFAELIAHIANSNFFFCSQVKGELPRIKANGDKESLVKLLSDSLSYCDGAYGALTDANFAEIVKVSGATPSEATRGAVVIFNTAHNNEHYGNLVVYLRLKGHVPPSTSRVHR